MSDKTYTKVFKERNYDEKIKIEYECLNRLKNNFECICKRKSNHFPIIDETLCTDNTIVMSHCGKSLGLEMNDKIEPKIENSLEQIDCILHNLKKCDILHLDVLSKNICISESGVISLIDYNIAVINDNFHFHDKRNTPYKSWMKNLYYVKQGGNKDAIYNTIKQKLVDILITKQN